MQEHGQSFHPYQAVTDQITALLEKGTIPWRKPWSDGGPPMNAMTRRPYQGINLWLLLAQHYSSPLYLTFEQVQRLGGAVGKGERGHLVVFWALSEPEEKDGEEDPSAPKRRPLLRYYKLFNVEQCRYLPPAVLETAGERHIHPVAVCEGIVQTMPQRPEIRFEKSKAFYHPTGDYINMPPMKHFGDSEGYYSTLFHELVHSTGHVGRLGRKSLTEMAEFGSPVYSFEELVAELGACYLCSHAGILQKEIRNSAAYIKGWLSKLKADPRCIVTASAQAQKAVDFILQRKPEVTLLGQPEGDRA